MLNIEYLSVITRLQGEDHDTAAPWSAYDALILKTADCDADSQVVNLFLDTMGYNTAVLGRPGHACCTRNTSGSPT